jgi:hypothetical protein
MPSAKSYHQCNGRAYIDTRSYYAQYPDVMPTINNIEDMGKGLALCPCEECLGCRAHPPDGFRWSDYDVIDPWKTKNLETNGSPEPSRHRYLLCPRKLHGLVLKSRTWGNHSIVLSIQLFSFADHQQRYLTLQTVACLKPTRKLYRAWSCLKTGRH